MRFHKIIVPVLRPNKIIIVGVCFTCLYGFVLILSRILRLFQNKIVIACVPLELLLFVFVALFVFRIYVFLYCGLNKQFS